MTSTVSARFFEPRASPIEEKSSSRLRREQQASIAATPPSPGAPLATSEAESIQLPVAWLESAAMTWASCPGSSPERPVNDHR